MNSGRAGDDDVLVLPPLPADPLFVDAVDDAVAGSVDDLPDAQPQRTLAGNARDFASLYIRHRASFGLHARRFLYDPRDVEEVLQEAFLRLFLAMPELETELQALAYCRRTVTNLCIDRYRADQRRPRLVDLDAIEWDPSDEKSYEDPVLRAEDAAIVRQALALLTPMHRAALVKREIEEKPLPQIAEELGVPEESVKHLLYRARRALRRLLAGTSVEPGADLGNTELLRLANERLARATLRSANVLIVLFVAAVTVVGALRVGINDQVRRGQDVGPVVTPPVGAGGPVGHPHPVTPRHPAVSKPSRTSHKAPTATTTRKPAVAPVVPTHKETFASRKPAKHVSHSSTPPKQPVSTTPFTISAPSVGAEGAAQVFAQSRDVAPSGSVSLTAAFVAPTTSGVDFRLEQTVVTDASATPQLNLAPAVQTGVGTAEVVDQIDSSATTDGDGATTLFSTFVVLQSDGASATDSSTSSTPTTGSASTDLSTTGASVPTQSTSPTRPTVGSLTPAVSDRKAQSDAFLTLQVQVVVSEDGSVLAEHVVVQGDTKGGATPAQASSASGKAEVVLRQGDRAPRATS